jgi:hypothetical protein
VPVEAAAYQHPQFTVTIATAMTLGVNGPGFAIHLMLAA